MLCTPNFSLFGTLGSAESPKTPTSITHPTITNFRMLGSAEPRHIKKPTFMSSVPTARNVSPCFFYITSPLSLHCARYVLVHALLLVACSSM